ncbi:MAG: HisA/HisF-related TIM barrel protein, partial [Bacillota bacterium]|nr:HisA/HisF-related TIM barrel protein [Bacillota bacterium]
MIIYPAVDIKDGKCVRLKKGEAGSETAYGDPLEMALKWQGAGA